MSRKIRVINVVGARPNFMKIAPLMRAFAGRPRIEPLLVHTGQHYDERMSDLFFRQLGIPAPDVNLEVGSGSHAAQTAEIMKRFEPVVIEQKPDAVLVVGDVNSTIACALVAKKLGAKIIHVEAGLRSFDRSMPEEINRVLTDAISDLLLVSEQSGIENLKREGVDEAKIFLVGNVMIDTLEANRRRAADSDVLERFSLSRRGYGLVTLHRPANVDDPAILEMLLGVLNEFAGRVKLVWPIHPRSLKNLERFGLRQKAAGDRWLTPEPLAYLDFLKLMDNAAVVLTDSGGIQEETTILGTPCLTLRENTERPATVTAGTNVIVGRDPARIRAAFEAAMADTDHAPRRPPLWDGAAAERIADVLVRELG
jgi:UDP-N-acetylglucosamine 2-epimerase (non-hydrolysing)